MAYLFGTVTQGGADAFAIADVQTALTGQTSNAYRVLELSYEINGLGPFVAAASMDFELCLSRRTKIAMPNVDDVDVLRKWKFNLWAPTAAGGIGQPEAIGVWRPPGDMVIVEDPLYWMIDSTATTGTLNALIRIEYEIVTISQIDRLTLLTLSL